MQTSDGHLQCRLSLSDDSRSFARIITLVVGRGFAVRRCDFRPTLGGEASLTLEVHGPPTRHNNLLERLGQVVGVRKAETFDGGH